MVNRSDHREAVARRLELLRAELAGDEPTAPRYLELVSETSAPESADEPARAPEVPPVVPLPGRHAARRRSPGVSADALPAAVRNQLAVGPWHIAVVALLLVAGLALTCWRMVRSDAEAPLPGVVPAAPVIDDMPSAAASGAAASSSARPSASPAAPAPSASVTVDVAGKVRHPGVLVLPAGARVVDALAAAGGARAGVPLTGLNQARVLLDGEQIVVGGPAHGGTSAGAGAPHASDALVNLNTATVTQLEELPEVGPVTAQAIVTWRDEHGGFSAVDELLEIDGIGEKTLSRIAPHVTV